MQHTYILNSLAETKSIILLTDIDNADSLILPLFATCFDIVSGSAKGSTGAAIEKCVEFNMNALLITVIDEVAALPAEVVDIIISQLLRVDARSIQHIPGKNKKGLEPLDEKQSKLLLKDYPPAYNMAKAICTGCPEKMTSQVSQYFNNVLVDASAPKHSAGHAKHGRRRMSNLDESEDEAEDVKELGKAHQLIRELWRACPDVLLNVIPQLEAELSAESVSLRLLATETLGDVAAGIGISGPPPPPQLDPAAYPTASLLSVSQTHVPSNRLLVPMSPKPFAISHAGAYVSFISRRQDKSSSVRAAWATAVGRILLTSFGGVGFDQGEEARLAAGLAQMLNDADEKVRMAAIRVIGAFGYSDVVNKLATHGGMSKDGSVLATLSERVKDRKHSVREEAMKVLGRFWGVAAGDIENRDERVIDALGDAPKRIIDAYYTNDPDVHALLDRVIFEDLLPLSFPRTKARISRTNSQKQRATDKEFSSQEGEAIDPDTVRVRRILTLVQSLDDKAKKVFFGLQARQVNFAKVTDIYLKACETYNGGVMEENAKSVKADLGRYIDGIAKMLCEPSRISTDLWKFAKMHDRRNYQLIRYSMGAEHDYRTVTKAIKELSKRIQNASVGTASLLDTITPLLYRCSLIIYNRSHVPAIMAISRTDENGLAESAHEVLKEISTRHPEVLRTQVQQMCKDLEARAPTASEAEDMSAPDTLKACAAFARKFPGEISRDWKFLGAMTNFALYAQSTRAAKHAVSVILAVADKKEMYAKELIQKAVKDCTYGSQHFLTRLATISQITLRAPGTANAEADTIVQIALKNVLLCNHEPSSEADAYTWSSKPSDETIAKELALKIMVNRCRSEEDNGDSASFHEVSTPLYAILTKLITNEGELHPAKNTSSKHKPRLRMAAARFLLKLCSHERRCEDLVTPKLFNEIALVALDRLAPVRTGFVNQLKKYIGQNRLNSRWYTILFVLAFEPDTELKSSTITWLRSRVQYLALRQMQHQAHGEAAHENVMEATFARLLSLLAHHPDYPDKASEEYRDELVDFARYIVFYLSAVGNEDNLSLIFHVAQRVKQTRDAITGTAEASERLYVLSDLAQACIRYFADLMSHQKGHSANVNMLQTWPGKFKMPAALFAALPSHDIAQQIADKNFLPEDIAGELEKLVKSCMKTSRPGHHVSKAAERKRKSDAQDNEEAEKPIKKSKRTATLPVRRGVAKGTPKPKTTKGDDVPSSEAPRKSTRTSNTNAVSYADRDSDEDDAEMEEIDQTVSAATSSRKARRPAEKQEGNNPLFTAALKEKENANCDDKRESEFDKEDEADVEEASSQESSPSPLRAKSNGVTKHSKQKTPPARPPRKSMFDSGKESMRKTAASRKVTPLKKNLLNGNVRETRRTGA